MSGDLAVRHQERRHHRRVSLTEVVRLDGRVPATTTDLSLGGIGVLSEHPPAIGSRVRVSARFSDGSEVDTDAEVVRVSGSHVALRFVALEQRSLIALIAQVGRHD